MRKAGSIIVQTRFGMDKGHFHFFTLARANFYLEGEEGPILKMPSVKINITRTDFGQRLTVLIGRQKSS